MSQPGIGAMLHALGGGSANDPAKYFGRTIASAALDKENDRVRLEFADSTKIAIWDNGQSCCESRYITCDDDLSKIVGGVLVSIDAKSGPEVEEDYNLHEQVFIDLVTTKGTVTFTTHNEHNGYYGGFGLTITEESRQPRPEAGMPKFDVTIPIAGHIHMTVTAKNEAEAIEKAMDKATKKEEMRLLADIGIGGSHLGSSLTDLLGGDFPERFPPGMPSGEAREAIAAHRQRYESLSWICVYDMWVAWAAIMRARQLYNPS